MHVENNLVNKWEIVLSVWEAEAGQLLENSGFP